MPSYQELQQRYDQIKTVLANGADATLRAIPGVRHICVALKVTGEFVTDKQCIRVYVREKLPDDEVPPEEQIPSSIDGVDTDVVVVQPFEFSVDTQKYRPLKGGIMISNLIIDVNEAGNDQTMGVATFGCTATRIRDGKPMLLTNAHVLRMNGGKKGDSIFQPAPLSLPQFRLDQLPKRRSTDEDLIAFIAETEMNDKVDAGVARLDVSSCCRCCGLDFRDEIVGLSVDGTPPSNKILGLRHALPGQTVFKVGITTGRTVGKVVTDDTDALPPAKFQGKKYSFVGQIEIASDDDDPFSLHGDSGAVIIDEDGFILGLLAGSVGVLPPDARTFANHISDVTSALGITINIDRSTHHSSGARVAVPRATFAFEPNAQTAALYATSKARLLSDPAGAWLWAMGETYREEILTLITSHRPVTVVWHRAGGPAVFAAALKTIREGGETLPVPPNGTTLEAGLSRVGDALAAHGSPALRAAIAEHREVLLNAVHDSVTLDDVLGKLRDAATLAVDV
jgi:hypothetical protein